MRQKSYAFINIFGLAIGLACSILIGLYVKHEYSYDNFHKHSDRLYRVILDFKMGTNKLAGPISPAPLANEIMKQFPEAEAAVRIHHQSNMALLIDNKTYYEDLFFYADSNIFDVFNIKFIEGNSATALTKPHSVVLTKSISEKYFGTSRVIGKTFRITDSDPFLYEVTGVVEPFPSNSHFHFNMLASMSGYADSKIPFWLSNNYYTYIKLKSGTNEEDFNKKLTELFQKNAGPQLQQFFNLSIHDFIKSGNHSYYAVQKVTDIHLKSNLNYEIESNGSLIYVSIFILVALFVLLNACINFTNLATARSANRSKEVGLRKVLGSDKKSLILQFLAESVFISYLAVLLAILIVEILLPQFNNLLSVNLQLTLKDYLSLLPLILFFATIVGIVSGAYPAFYLSSFNPDEVLKNKYTHRPSRPWIRNALVIFQFTVSIVILLATMLVASQLRYIQSKKLGFDKNRLMVIERTNPIKKDMKVFLDELQKCSSIESVSLSSGIPGRESGDQSYRIEGRSSSEIFVINTFGVNYSYIETMGIKLKDGRFFSKDHPSDTMAVVINEATARYLGLKKPIGEKLVIPGRSLNHKTKLTIVGMIEDFHYESLHRPVNPLLLFLIPEYYDGYVNVRISEGKEKDVVEFVNLSWRNLVPDAPLQYFHYNDQFQKMYKKEIETYQLMNVLSLIAILIASMGLFGLVAFMADRRTKEIGVRKVLGSSVWRIIRLMTSEITILIIISYVLAAPLAFWWMHHWLIHFAYKTPINAILFIIAFFIATLVAWLTISILAFKAATRNPVEALRYE